jgi:hypothetical protein
MAVLCRFGEAPRMTRIHANQKMVGAARRADPRFRRERAVSPNPNPPAETPRRGGGNLATPGILPRRAEIRVSRGLTRRHEATKKIRCRNGSPLPFQTGPRMTRIHANQKMVGAARRADPRFRRERAVSPNPNPPAKAPGRGGGNFGIAQDSATPR